MGDGASRPYLDASLPPPVCSFSPVAAPKERPSRACRKLPTSQPSPGSSMKDSKREGEAGADSTALFPPAYEELTREGE